MYPWHCTNRLNQQAKRINKHSRSVRKDILVYPSAICDGDVSLILSITSYNK